MNGSLDIFWELGDRLCPGPCFVPLVIWLPKLMCEVSSLDAHYVYIGRCANGALYTGYARNVVQRVAAHNAGKGGRYTRSHRPVELLANWCLPTQRIALQVEYRIKRLSHQQKQALTQTVELLDWLLNDELRQV